MSESTIVLSLTGANDVVEGGAGDDVFSVTDLVNSVLGGSGNDHIRLLGSSSEMPSAPLTIDAGNGADTVVIEGRVLARTTTIAGGEGSDTYVVQSSEGHQDVTILDFAPGAGGDRIDVTGMGMTDGRNPFSNGSPLRLVQHGADTVLQGYNIYLADGSFVDLLRLKNIDRSALTVDNFVKFLNPDGSQRGLTLAGTAGADTLLGGVLDDRLVGGAGDDWLAGDMGDDVLEGGDGNDWLDGDRSDFATDPDLWIDSSHDHLDGGAGNDFLNSSWGNDILLGGSGDDHLRVHTSPPSAHAGFSVTLDGGDGNDRLQVTRGSGANPFSGGADLHAELRGGAGSDLFQFSSDGSGETGDGNLTVLDFQAGAGGDVLDMFSLGERFASTTFASGHLRLRQDGADTAVQFDRDAGGTWTDFVDMVTLKNVAIGSLVAANMRHGHMPGGAVVEGVTRVGTGGADRLQGGAGNDTLHGLEGRDTALYAGPRAAYEVTVADTPGASTTRWLVGDLRGGPGDGIDTLTLVERLQFADGAIALDLEGAGGQAYRIYRAAFDRAPDETGLGYWIAALDGGASLEAVAGGFADSQEFRDLYGSAPSHADVVTLLYRNVLDREPDANGYAFWLDVLESGRDDVAGVLASFSESAENVEAVAQLIGQGIAYQAYGG